MIAMINVELRKLNGSLALLLAVVAPLLPALLATLSIPSNRRTVQWESIFTQFVLPVWCLFLLPMVVAAFTTLVAQVEYRGRAWDHLLTLPVERWHVFLAKALIVLGAAVMMTLLALLFTWAGAAVAGSISGHGPVGALPWGRLGRLVPLILAASAMLIVIQLWVALRFVSFVVPLSVGIGGTLVALAVAMTRTDQAKWFPWVLPLDVLTAADPVPFAVVGGVGGLVIIIVMIVDLCRHDFGR